MGLGATRFDVGVVRLTRQCELAAGTLHNGCLTSQSASVTEGHRAPAQGLEP